MTTKRPKRRVYFRWLSLALWLTLLGLAGALLYLNQVGLPGFIKRPLLEKLKAQGLDLEFSRLRLSWYRGILAENVSFGQANRPLSPRATFGRVQLQLDYRALARRQFQVEALALRRGRLVWPLARTNQPPRQLTLDRLETDLRFLPNDQWALVDFNASFLGAKLQLSGSLTHASAARNWKFLQPQAHPPGQAAAQWQARLGQLADALEQSHFAAPPEVRLHVRGDATHLDSFIIHLFAAVPGARTPWGTLTQGQLNARLLPATTNRPPRAQLSLAAAAAQTPWATVTNLRVLIRIPSFQGPTNSIPCELTLRAGDAETPWASASNLQLETALAPAQDQPGRVSGDLVLRADRLNSKWGGGSNVRFAGRWVQALTNPVPLSAEGRLNCGALKTQWGRAAQARVLARLASDERAAAPASTHPDWAGWAGLEPYALNWDCHLAEVQTDRLAAREVACAGAWRAPTLTVTNLEATFTNGHLGLRAALNVATRALEAAVTSNADPRQLTPFLPKSAAHWAAALAWNQPPSLAAKVALVLPAWTNRQPDWQAEIQPSLRVEGELEAPAGGAYKEVSVSRAQCHFSYSNQCWQLAQLLITRPKGQKVVASYSEDALTRQFRWRLAGNLDPGAVRPLLGPEERGGLDFFTFTQPPVIEAEVCGVGADARLLGIWGRAALTNFTFRGESASSLQTGFAYSNQVLRLDAPRLLRADGQLTADSVVADFNAQKVYITNGLSTADPMVVARAIGPPTAQALEPFHFLEPPAVRVHGIAPMHGEEADLFFGVQAGPFHWLTFTVPHVAADLHWAGLELFLTNVSLGFYGGNAEGSASFDFDSRHPGTDCQFALRTSGTLLHHLMADLSTPTNHLEGLLTGNLVITGANSADWRQTQGYGNVQLRDGLLWDIPLFGVFSPVLDALAPGLGSSRASRGSCRFTITNGVVRSDDLEIHSPPVRLLYRGSADLQGRLNARVEARVLRDMPLFGPLVSLAFWPVSKLFEYKVTGSLDQPKTEPLYLLPKILLLPLHPLRTLKGLVPEEPASARTNAPPAIGR